MNTPGMQETKTARPPESPGPEKIEDFGTHIPGARKELAAARLARGLERDPEFQRALSESWPAPAWGGAGEGTRRRGSEARGTGMRTSAAGRIAHPRRAAGGTPHR